MSTASVISMDPPATASRMGFPAEYMRHEKTTLSRTARRAGSSKGGGEYCALSCACVRVLPAPRRARQTFMRGHAVTKSKSVWTCA